MSDPDMSDAEMAQASPAGAMLYVGTHRRAHRADPADIAFGIHALPAGGSGELGAGAPAIATPQPGWIAIHPGNHALYAVNEVRDGADRPGISAFAIDPRDGSLRLLGSLPTPPMPCHCAVDASGRFLLVATFGGGSVHLFRLAPDGGLIEECDRHQHDGHGTHPVRQTAPHAHAVAITPDQRFVLVPDLGTDRVMVYRFDRAAARLVPLPERALPLPAQSGPRHIAFSTDGRIAWLINEMSATVMVLAIDGESGALALLQTLDLLPADHRGLRSGAALEVSRDGRHLYATTRSHGSSGMPAAPGIDSLVWFAIAPETGLLTLAGRLPSGGGIARSMALAPDGSALLVAHQCSGTIVRFALDPASGAPSAPTVIAQTPVPVALAFYPVNNIDRHMG